MKNIWTCIVLVIFLSPGNLLKTSNNKTSFTPAPVNNLFIITIDGFRWQEVFKGADSILVNMEEFTPDTSTLKMLYWDSDLQKRRQKLMPFFWSVLEGKGQLFGNREYDNKMNVANLYADSYPGYHEIFTGNTDADISSNKKRNNPHITILEYLNNQPAFHSKVVAFTSWDVFPFIFNTDRSRLQVNSGYEKADINLSLDQQMIDKVQTEAVFDKTATRYDMLTFLTAKEYINRHRPRVVYLGFGETDEFAHQGRYDLYLEQANKIDRMIAELWHWVQTTPEYKNNTTFIITTDHGRGNRTGAWTSHGEFIRGSSQTWMAVIGPGIQPLGEIKESQQFYQQQLAQTFAKLLGEEFKTGDTAPPISLR